MNIHLNIHLNIHCHFKWRWIYRTLVIQAIHEYSYEYSSGYDPQMRERVRGGDASNSCQGSGLRWPSKMSVSSREDHCLPAPASGCWGQPFSTGGLNPGSPRGGRRLRQVVSSRGTPTTSPSPDRCLDLFYLNIQSSFLDVLDIHLDIHSISEYSKRIFKINFWNIHLNCSSTWNILFYLEIFSKIFIRSTLVILDIHMNIPFLFWIFLWLS